MKIIRKDNFDRENISDSLVAENVGDYYGNFIVKKLNERFSGDRSPDYFMLVENDHKLYIFEP